MIINASATVLMTSVKAFIMYLSPVAASLTWVRGGPVTAATSVSLVSAMHVVREARMKALAMCTSVLVDELVLSASALGCRLCLHLADKVVPGRLRRRQTSRRTRPAVALSSVVVVSVFLVSVWKVPASLVPHLRTPSLIIVTKLIFNNKPPLEESWSSA